MIQETIKYHDLEGNPCEDTFYFHMSKAELAAVTQTEGDFAAYLRKIVATDDAKKILDEFKKIIEMTVGQKSDDGKRFIKNDEIRSKFMDSDAYSEFFMKLLTDADYASRFVNGIMPADLQEQLASTTEVAEARKVVLNADIKELNALPEEDVDDEKDPADPASYTRQELLDMDDDFFNAIVGPVKPGMNKTLLSIALQRRNRSK